MSQEIDHVETASCTQGDEKIGALEACTPRAPRSIDGVCSSTAALRRSCTRSALIDPVKSTGK